MLGIWEYFWDLLDWTGPGPVNLCRVTATVSSIHDQAATVSSMHEQTANTAQLTNMTGRM
jgi:hypothetical protein